MLGADLPEAAAQDIRIKQGRAFLLNDGAGLVEPHQERVSVLCDAMASGPVAEKGDDGWLPVDQGSVNVEGDDVKIVEREGHAGFRLNMKNQIIDYR